ncbi:MAG: sel1 repeat family protein [Akkermansiaceae bacterium]|nr:sel1 repeat family protein [Akkermansiaceae bacterium]
MRDTTQTQSLFPLVMTVFMLSVCAGWCEMARGVYAYTENKWEKDSGAKIRQFVSIDRGGGAYYVRLTTGTQIKVASHNFRGAVSYPSARDADLSNLELSRTHLRQFMRKFPASNRYLSGRVTNVSIQIAKLEEATKQKRKTKEVPLGSKKSPEEERVIQLEKKADAGDLEAQWELANDYYTGEKVPRDLGKAFKYYKQAGEQGCGAAQLLVGICYYKGEGVVRDLNDGAIWMAKAARQGLPEAETCLGIFYLRGEGVDKDPREACRWLKKSATSGRADAQYLLGVCYYLGEGVDESRQKAKEWLQKARDGKVEAAAEFLEKHGL